MHCWPATSLSTISKPVSCFHGSNVPFPLGKQVSPGRASLPFSDLKPAGSVTPKPMHPVLGQSPGGNIFGGSDQTVGNGVREGIRWARNILFLLGIGACAWGAVNIFLEKPYARQFIGGGAAMGFGGIASLAYSFAKGQAVNVDTDVGQ